MAKQKLKTHSGAKKRLKKTASGKIKVGHSGKRHLNTGKGKRRLRRLSQSMYVFKGLEPRLTRLLPNG
jgi:large subunit ribosomal protein L35